MPKPVLTVVLASQDLAVQNAHLARGALFLPEPDPAPEPFAEIVLRVETPRGVAVELEGRVLQILSGRGIAIAFDEMSDAKKALAPLFAEQPAGDDVTPTMIFWGRTETASKAPGAQAQAPAPAAPPTASLPAQPAYAKMSLPAPPTAPAWLNEPVPAFSFPSLMTPDDTLTDAPPIMFPDTLPDAPEEDVPADAVEAAAPDATLEVAPLGPETPEPPQAAEAPEPPAEAEPEPEPEDDRDAAAKLRDEVAEMTTNQKMQLALHGDRLARLLLLKEPNKSFQMFILQNNRITTEEVRYIAGYRQASPDALQTIANHREWGNNQGIVGALVRNPKTPGSASVKLLDKLPMAEIRRLAKSPDVPRNVQTAARKRVAEAGTA